MEEKSGFYRSNTRDIEINVKPQYIDKKTINNTDSFVWAYHIIIKNKSSKTIQLMSRYWKIIDERGGIQEVSGEGVVGETPTLKPGGHFQYTSGVELPHPSGIMRGTYKMKTDDAQEFDVKIPSFSLDTPDANNTIN